MGNDMANKQDEQEKREGPSKGAEGGPMPTSGTFSCVPVAGRSPLRTMAEPRMGLGFASRVPRQEIRKGEIDEPKYDEKRRIISLS